MGDAALLKEIINILKNEKITNYKFYTYTPELSLSKGNYSKHRPDKKDQADINNALKHLKRSNQYSHVQGAISRNNHSYT